jgi:hypothetical protein
MWRLICVVFWLSVVVFLLPKKPSVQMTSTTTVSERSHVSDRGLIYTRDSNRGSTQKVAHGTLTSADRAPPWRGPHPN